MSDISQMEHAFFDMLEGKIDFSGMIATDGAVIAHRIAQAPAMAQPVLQIAYESFKATASTLVGAGETALGQIINTSSDTQATMLLNMMQAAGIPTAGPLTIAEHAGLVTLLNGAKAYIDRFHIERATQGEPVAQVQAEPQAEPEPQPEPVP